MLEKSSSRFFCFFNSAYGSMAAVAFPPFWVIVGVYSLP